MISDSPDKEERSNGTVSYLGWTLVGYVISYPFIQAYGSFAPRLWPILDVIYWPIDRLVEAVGLTEQVDKFVGWLSLLLP